MLENLFDVYIAMLSRLFVNDIGAVCLILLCATFTFMLVYRIMRGRF